MFKVLPTLVLLLSFNADAGIVEKVKDCYESASDSSRCADLALARAIKQMRRRLNDNGNGDELLTREYTCEYSYIAYDSFFKKCGGVGSSSRRTTSRSASSPEDLADKIKSRHDKCLWSVSVKSCEVKSVYANSGEVVQDLGDSFLRDYL